MGTSETAQRVNRKIRTVVVGVDGSVESLSALRWAGQVIEPDGIIHAVAAISPVSELAMAAVQFDSAKAIKRLTHDLETTWAAPLRSAGRNVACQVIESEPADALLETGEGIGADLIVVGVHAKPKHAPRTLGRVTAKIIQLADRPLAIVEDDRDRLPLADSPDAVGPTIVVHAGHGRATEAAVHWAADFAAVHGTGLSLVRSTPNHPSLGPDGLLDVLAFYLDPAMLQEWAGEDLARLADEIQRSTEEDLQITWTSTTGAPGPRLIEASANASLVVVGRNTRAGRGHIIPSELRHVAVHAPCPVVVVPPEG